jgi:CHAT domain-containing protein
VESPSAADIAATAARLQAAVVEYLVTDTGAFGWVVQGDGSIHVARLDGGRERLESLTRTVRSAIESTPRTAARNASLTTALRDLDRILIEPLRAWLPASPDATVVIVPHGPLAVLPFAALADSSGRPLIERHTLLFAPAVSVYAYTREKSPEAARNRGALVVADPLPPADSASDRLLWAREEGRQVASRLHAGPVRLLVDRSATESAVKRLAREYAIIHLATHGLVAPEQPFASSLLLADGEGEDGYLRVDEIFSLDLHADLVVLSGCSTGMGKLTGDGIVGLTRAFLYAGAATVVVSQWNVSDRATSRFMDRFYAQRQRGMPTARALRNAALSMRRLGADASAWAAFEVIGEP